MSASGLVVVDKPAGLTSHDVVARCRRLVGTRRVGHAGTLDPMATGVLLLGVGKGTRLLGHLALADKRYVATVRLGARTSTDDAEGDVLEVIDAGDVAEEDLRAAVGRLTGPLQQVPSSVSAVKVDGRRAYARVRAGEDVALPARPVTVHAFTVEGLRREGAHVDVDVEVHCSTGTYVRALARDLGADLGVGGHLVRLRRTAVGPVGLDEAVDLEAAQREGSLPVGSLEDWVPRFFPARTLSAEETRAVGFGRPLDRDVPGPTTALLAPDGTFVALYAPRGGVEPGAVPVAVFAPAGG